MIAIKVYDCMRFVDRKNEIYSCNSYGDVASNAFHRLDFFFSRILCFAECGEISATRFPELYCLSEVFFFVKECVSNDDYICEKC